MAKKTATKTDDFVPTGPGTLAGRYLRRFWQPVYVASQLEKGRPVRIRIMSENFTLYRGESGQPHLVAERCPHRLTALHTGWVEGDSIRCYYHGWRFESSGQCVEQPGEPKPFCQKVKIASYPTREQLGCIFAYLGEGEPPPFHRWPEFEDALGAGGTLDVAADMLPCNYFQSAENIVDDVHVAFAHRDDFLNTRVRRTIPRVAAQETSFGLTQLLHHPDRTDKIHFIMPNLSYLAFATKPFTATNELDESGKTTVLRYLFAYVPIDDVSHLHFQIIVWPKGWPAGQPNTPPATPAHEEVTAILAGQKRVSELSRHPSYIVIQDGVSVVGQGAIVDRSSERLGSTDAAVIRLRKIWLRELRLLAQGKPLTPFGRPDPAALQKEEQSLT